MWIPAHVGQREGNKIVYERHAALNGDVFEIPLSPMDFQGLARSVLLREWQFCSLSTPEGFSSTLV
jgi:hypothetical protein